MLQYSYNLSERHLEAVKWYKKAAQQGLAEADRVLAFCYSQGYGRE